MPNLKITHSRRSLRSSTPFLLVVLIAAGLGAILPTGRAFAAEKKTTLRGIGEPKGTFRNSITGLTLTEVSWSVRNVGEETAQGVSVSVVEPGGKSVTLSGPASLAPNKQATYSTTPLDKITSAGKLKGTVSCSNCN